MSALWRMITGMPRYDESLTRVELARLEGTVAALVKELQSFRDAVGVRLDDHETRIRRNERWRVAMPATVITAVFSAFLSLFRVHG